MFIITQQLAGVVSCAGLWGGDELPSSRGGGGVGAQSAINKLSFKLLERVEWQSSWNRILSLLANQLQAYTIKWIITNFKFGLTPVNSYAF